MKNLLYTAYMYTTVQQHQNQEWSEEKTSYWKVCLFYTEVTSQAQRRLVDIILKQDKDFVKLTHIQRLQISDHADGGPRFRVCARQTLRSAPQQHEQKFSSAHVCKVTLKHLPQPLGHIRSFGTLG
jgi:hypothetical protein